MITDRRAAEQLNAFVASLWTALSAGPRHRKTSDFGQGHFDHRATTRRQNARHVKQLVARGYLLATRCSKCARSRAGRTWPEKRDTTTSGLDCQSSTPNVGVHIKSGATRGSTVKVNQPR
jgi:hypothetical protein